VFIERIARFDPDERALGWHVQYDELRPGHDFLAYTQRLTEYDAERVKLELLLRHRGVEELELSLRDRNAAIAVTQTRVEALEARVAALTNHTASIDDRLLKAVNDGNRLARERDRLDERLVDSESSVSALNERLADLEERERQSRMTIARLETSRRWTWTLPLRAIARWLGLRPPTGSKSH
jgi:chromosome segregation ATPase